MSDPKNNLKKQLAAPSIWRRPWVYLGILAGLIAAAFVLYQLPFIHDRASIYVENLYSSIYYRLNPPSEAVFDPSQQGTVSAQVAATITAMAPTSEPLPTGTAAPELTPTGAATMLPTLTPIPVPVAYTLEGMGLEYQTFNNCGPANLSMDVTYWGWPATQDVTESRLKSHPDDRNVMLTEMLDYVRTYTELDGLIRYGGTIERIKPLIAAGFPVLLERGHTDPKDGWMGHYSIITAYDDSSRTVTIPDTLLGVMTLSYDDLALDWAHFDGIYLVIFPPDRQNEVLTLLGEDADPQVNLQRAVERVSTNLQTASGRELFFAWYSLGSLKVLQQDYPAAAEAYDQAFSLYGQLPVSERPWRITWYQVGPYEAYYYTARFEDVVNLAQQTLDNTREDSLPETWLWAGRAALMLRDKDKARAYLQGALEWYPGWDLALAEMAKLDAGS